MLLRSLLLALLLPRGLHVGGVADDDCGDIGGLELERADIGAVSCVGARTRTSKVRAKPALRWSVVSPEALPLSIDGTRPATRLASLGQPAVARQRAQLRVLAQDVGARRRAVGAAEVSCTRSNEPAKSPVEVGVERRGRRRLFVLPATIVLSIGVSGAPPASTRMIPPLRYPVLLATVESVTVTSSPVAISA